MAVACVNPQLALESHRRLPTNAGSALQLFVHQKRLNVISEDKILGLLRVGGSRWIGGTVYLQNLLQAILHYVPWLQIKLFVRATDDSLEYKTRADDKLELVRLPFSRGLLRATTAVFRRISGYDLELTLASLKLRERRLDAVFPTYYRSTHSTATLAWIPDFQHLHLPEMFSASDIRGRNRGFRKAIGRSRLTILSSNAARQDLEALSWADLRKVRVVPFVVHVPECVYERDPSNVVRKYGLPEKFFYLPNQFWKHKNHEVVFEALEIIKRERLDAFVVCTGERMDLRNPSFYGQLIERVKCGCARENILLLGIVPREDVYQLIRQSIGVINPSLFEGWSTTVEEAKSVGKTVLLSDLPVHREQCPSSANYFDPTDARGLAALLAAKWCSTSPGPDRWLELKAREQLSSRLRAYGEMFSAAVAEAIELTRLQKRTANRR